MKKIKSFLQIRTSVLQSDCPLPRMLPLSYTRQYKILKTTSVTLSRHIGTGPACLYQFVCYTISGGRHFPPKSNDDCLPWLLSPSLFYLKSKNVFYYNIISHKHYRYQQGRITRKMRLKSK